PGRAGRPGRPVRAAAAPLHRRTAVGRPVAGAGGPDGRWPPRAQAPDPAGRGRPEPARPAARLPFPHPLLEGAGHLQDGAATAGGEGAGPLCRVPLPREQLRSDGADLVHPLTVGPAPHVLADRDDLAAPRADLARSVRLVIAPPGDLIVRVNRCPVLGMTAQIL